MRRLLFLCVLFASFVAYAAEPAKKIYVIELQKEIDAPAARIISRGLQEAQKNNSDYILLHLNTYGGELSAADSIRTALMHCPVPVIAFIDNQAASAGALIAIACDSIYMRSGGSIGAASVVNQTGEPMPDKYQSFMRSMMRATAESHGKRKVVQGLDTIEVWHRDPSIAEAMVGTPRSIDGLVDSTRVLTFTTDEAIANGYCEGRAESIDEVLTIAQLKPADVEKYLPSWLEKIIIFLMNPVLQGLLLMLIIGGIYFELQTPGIGFPLLAAIVGALLYFAPLYLEGLAEYWELLLFVAGLALIALELFVVPGFGITGISGIILCVTGLVLAMVNNDLFTTPEGLDLSPLGRPLFIVSAGVFGGLTGSIYLTRRLYHTHFFGRIALKTDLTGNTGYIGVPTGLETLIGQEGIARTSLRPSGKVEINGEVYDAVAQHGLIEKNSRVKIVAYETGQLYCSTTD